jgi:UTP:GlnB (protein PII) uridylyltransferase
MFLKLLCLLTKKKKNLQIDEDDFKEEQNSVARLIQMLYNDDPEEMFKVFYLWNIFLHDSFSYLYKQCLILFLKWISWGIPK